MRFAWTTENRNQVVVRSFLPGLNVALRQWQAALFDWSMVGLAAMTIVEPLLSGRYDDVLASGAAWVIGWIGAHLI